MFNDPIIRTPINGTAARVASQKGCTDKLTTKQERDNLVSHANQLEAELLTLPKKSKKRKELGLKKLVVCQEISAINAKMKKLNIEATGRDEYVDCVFHIMKEQLSPYKYKQIMKLARELRNNDLELLNKKDK